MNIGKGLALGVVAMGLLTPAAWADVVAHFKFESSSMGNTYDSIQNIPAEIRGTAGNLLLVPGGLDGNAARFDRSSAPVSNGHLVLTVDVGIVATIPGQGRVFDPHTISFWIKPDGPQGVMNWLSGYGLASPFFFGSQGLYVQPNSQPGGTWGEIAANSNEDGPMNLFDGQWHHLVFVYHGGGSLNVGDGPTVAIYFDGKLGYNGPTPAYKQANTHLTALNAGNVPLEVVVGGASYDNTTASSYGYYGGLMDDLQFYDHALGGAEVGLLYDNPGLNLTDIANIPEPASLSLLALGGLCLLRRRSH